MRGAAYTNGGPDFTKLFRAGDKSGEGALDLDEFRSAVRRVLKIPPGKLPDREIAKARFRGARRLARCSS